MIPQLIDAETVTVVGPVASGKTHLLKTWLRGIERRFVVFDPTAEYDDIQAEHFWSRPKDYAEYMARHPADFRAIYHPTDVDIGFETVVSGIWQMNAAESKWLFIEEVHELMSPWQKHEKMRILMKYARKRLIGMVGATQTLADLHKDFTRASRMIVVFHTSEPRDLEAMADRWGKEARAQVESLRPLLYDDATNTVHQVPEALVIRRDGTRSVELMA